MHVQQKQWGLSGHEHVPKGKVTVKMPPEISTSGSSVQERQSLLGINSAAPASEPHGQGQRGSTIAANTIIIKK